MAFVVEDGTGLADANSYATEDEFDDYIDDRGYTVPSGDTEQALVRATQALDAIYGNRFPGTPTHGRDQGLEWPRKDATDIDGNVIDDDDIPDEIIDATIELAFREATTPGSVLPDLARGGSIRRLRAGSVEIEYGANATATTSRQLVDGILAPLIGGGIGTSLVGTATRG